jgi:hypothetical protein
MYIYISKIGLSVYLWRCSPLLAIGRFTVSWSFTQSVGFLGRGSDRRSKICQRFLNTSFPGADSVRMQNVFRNVFLQVEYCEWAYLEIGHEYVRWIQLAQNGAQYRAGAIMIISLLIPRKVWIVWMTTLLLTSRVVFWRIYGHVVWWKSTRISAKHILSISRFEEKAKQGASLEWAAVRAGR